MTMRDTNSNRGIIAVLLTVLFLSAAAIPAGALPALSILITPDPPVQGQPLTVTVLLDGTPVPGADVYFVLSGGTPVHGQTDASGNVNYKPLLTGTLNITAMYMDMSASGERPVYEPAYGVDLTVDVAGKTVAVGVTATYTLTVTNKGNVTDTIDLTQGGTITGTLSKSSVVLDAGASEEVSLSVSSSTAGTYTTTVTATSQEDSTKSDSVTVTTTVEAPAAPAAAPRYIGGGAATPRDTDGDGISDLREMLAGTDPRNPCDPNPQSAACLAVSLPTPTPTPAPVVTPTPVVTPVVTPGITSVPSPAPAAPPVIPLYVILIAIVAALVIIAGAYWVRRRKP
jgi:hypothetical protein